MNGPWLHFGRILVALGIVLVVAGLLLMTNSRPSFLGFGRLPGDIAYKTKHGSFYFPIVTCLILSAVLTLILWLLSFWSRR